MANFDTFTPTEQAQMLEYDLRARGIAGNFAQLLSLIQAMEDYWTSTVGALIPNVDDDIPSLSGLAGIELKNGTFMNALHLQFATLLADNYTTADRQNYIELAGPGNVVGRFDPLI